MRRFVVWSLGLAVFLASSVVGQDWPVYPDSARLVQYMANLDYGYPMSRDFNGGGARALGMGNAYLALSDDATALTWNPAGLYQKDHPYEQPVMALGWNSLSNNVEFESPGFGIPGPFDRDESFNGIAYASLLAPVRIKGHTFIVSGAYNRVDEEAFYSALQLDTLIYYTLEDQLADSLRPWSTDCRSNYHSELNTINAGFGTRIYDRLSAGVAVNVYTGKAVAEQNLMVLEDGIIIEDLPGNQRGLVKFTRYISDSTKFSGVYFTLGLQYYYEKLRAGLILRTPHTLKEEIDVLVEDSAYVNGFARGGSKIHIDNNIIEMDMPFVIGLGLGYQALENLVVAADFEYRASGDNVINRRDSLRLVPGGKDTEYFTEIDPYWNDVVALRVGAEYLWATGSRYVPTVAFRSGFGWIQIPEPNIEGLELDPTGQNVLEVSTSTAAMTRWSLGTGIRWPQIHLDFAFASTNLDMEDDVFEQYSAVSDQYFNVTFTGFF